MSYTEPTTKSAYGQNLFVSILSVLPIIVLFFIIRMRYSFFMQMGGLSGAGYAMILTPFLLFYLLILTAVLACPLILTFATRDLAKGIAGVLCSFVIFTLVKFIFDDCLIWGVSDNELRQFGHMYYMPISHFFLGLLVSASIGSTVSFGNNVPSSDNVS